MNSFSVNGVSREAPIGDENSFKDLFDYLQSRLNSENEIISSIKVDGIELDEEYRSVLSNIPLSRLDTVEVTVVHPRELAEDTLQTLFPFLSGLSGLSGHVATLEISTPEFKVQFEKLLDGIDTFAQALASVRYALRITSLQSMSVLEADLAFILQHVYEAKQAGNADEIQNLLAKQLPAHLDEWLRVGLPDLVRCRDC
jgi:hypothetical protein